MSEQKISTPVKQPNTAQSNVLSSTPNKSDIKNLDFSTNISPIQSRASTPTSRTAMDLYAIIHESKKKIMKLKERNSSPTLSEKLNDTPQPSPMKTNTIKPSAESPRFRANKANLPISENVLKMNSNLRSSTPDRFVDQKSSPVHFVSERLTDQVDMRPNTPERLARRSNSGCSTPEKMFRDRVERNAPGSGNLTPERNVRIIPEGPQWPKAIPASHVPNLRSSPSPTYDYLNLSPSGHYQKTRSPSPHFDTNQYPSYPDYRSLPRMGRDSPRNSPTHFSTQSPSRQNVFAPRETATLDRRLLSPQHSTFASDRLGRVQPTSRNDFKQLLLRANWGTAPVSCSAVERLKNRTSPVRTKSWKSDILSSTIPEDCREDDDQSDRLTPERKYRDYNEGVLRSSALVSQQCKAFDKNRVSPTDKNRISPTLETAL